MERMALELLLDKHFPTHGNWLGLSLGWVAVVWLTHILSLGDHRLSHVQGWAAKRLHTLRPMLSPLQRQVLQLIGFNEGFYTKVADQFHVPTLEMRNRDLS
jgi:hypothetical protein